MTDPLQIIANGLATVSTHELFTYIETYIQKEQVERIVIGKPMQPNGQPSENLARVETSTTVGERLILKFQLNIMTRGLHQFWHIEP